MFSTLKEAFIYITSGNLVGKIFGFIRELILAGLFGTNKIVDSYRASQTAVLAPSNLFTNDALNGGFIPLYNRLKENDQKSADRLFKTVYIVLSIISGFLALFLYLSSGFWASVIAPGFDKIRLTYTQDMISVMGIGLVAYVQCVLFSYLEIANEKYFLTSIRSTFQSIGLIIGAITAYFFGMPILLAWGFSTAYFILFIFSLIYIKSMNFYKHIPGYNYRESKLLLIKFWKIIQPLLLVTFTVLLNRVIERVVGSYLEVGSIASLDYAKTIVDTGIGIISIPLGYVGLAKFTNMDNEKVDSHVSRIVVQLLIILIPISTIFFFNSEILIQTIFGRGEFDSNSIQLTAQMFKFLAISFWAAVTSYFLIKVLNSRFSNYQVLYITLLAATISILINVLCYRYVGPPILAISTSAYYLILFYFSLQRLNIGRKVGLQLIRTILYTFIFCVALFFISNLTINIYLLIISFSYWVIIFTIDPFFREKYIELVQLVSRKE